MTVIFLFPLFFSIVSVLAYLFVGDSIKWKAVSVVMVALSVVFQFVPQLNVHFLVPLFMQLAVCVVFAIYWQSNR